MIGLPFWTQMTFGTKKLLEVKRVFEKNSDLVYHTMCYLPKSFGFIKKKLLIKVII